MTGPAESVATVRVLLADDHPVFRAGLAMLINDTDGMAVVGQAATGQETVELCEQLQPDVVLMDLRMPGPIDGVEATRRIAEAGTAHGVLVLTMIDDDATVFAAMRAGARGYALKGSAGADIVESVRVVAAGKAVFGADIAARMSTYFGRPRAGGGPQLPQLSSRENEILDLLARGASNSAIAGRLHLSEKTVRNNISTILTKLSVSTRAEAAVRAREAGMGLT